ncbi:MAG: hypothetical protein L7H12_03005 [Sulfolobales archaeon]|nr:hypothetical protein [Sulfolobales archaeon]MCG2872135.1 hypothetical protein [Sulfolobales archaeon]MCG2907893.1 hypothetical protein [Sulfolobales archaeon]MCQ4448688.1 hypothetical protein [Sulfolobales archaeon]
MRPLTTWSFLKVKLRWRHFPLTAKPGQLQEAFLILPSATSTLTMYDLRG